MESPDITDRGCVHVVWNTVLQVYEACGGPTPKDKPNGWLCNKHDHHVFIANAPKWNRVN